MVCGTPQSIQPHAPRVNAPTVPSSNSKSYPRHLQSDGTDAEVARAYDVHPVTLSGWNTKLKETGSNAVGGSDEPKEKPDYEAPVEEAESLLSSRAS